MTDSTPPGSGPSSPGERGGPVRPLPPFDRGPAGSSSPEDRQDGFVADLFQRRYPEVTITALVFAVLIGVVMNAAITYAGLKIGFTLTGSAIAAVLGFGVLRGGSVDRGHVGAFLFQLLPHAKPRSPHLASEIRPLVKACLRSPRHPAAGYH